MPSCKQLTAHVAQDNGDAGRRLLSVGSRCKKNSWPTLLDIFDEEFERFPNEWAGGGACQQRFWPNGRTPKRTGDSCCPLLERLILHLGGKGSIMWRWLWIVGSAGRIFRDGFRFCQPLRNSATPTPIMPNDRFGIGVLLPFGVVVTILGFCRLRVQPAPSL